MPSTKTRSFNYIVLNAFKKLHAKVDFSYFLFCLKEPILYLIKKEGIEKGSRECVACKETKIRKIKNFMLYYMKQLPHEYL